ncbi:hypothetical protein PRNP1_010046 [Phytophthora ramorum]
MKVIALVAAGASILASVPAVQGHGYITKPAAQWTQGYPSNGYGGTIDNTIWGEADGSKYGYGPNGTVNFIKAMLPTKGGGSLSALIAKNQKLYSNEIDPECGLTAYKDSARSALPASQLAFTGFTHPGPCEVWCDDTKVLFDYDCQTKYPAIPATMPYDESKCANANRLTIYWIAVHGAPWQVYTDCVWLKGGSGRGAAPSGGGASTSTSTTTATTPTTRSSTTSEVAGEASTGGENSPTFSNTITVTASPISASSTQGTPATEAPAAEKCPVRRRK